MGVRSLFEPFRVGGATGTGPQGTGRGAPERAHRSVPSDRLGRIAQGLGSASGVSPALPDHRLTHRGSNLPSRGARNLDPLVLRQTAPYCGAGEISLPMHEAGCRISELLGYAQNVPCVVLITVPKIGGNGKRTHQNKSSQHHLAPIHSEIGGASPSVISCSIYGVMVNKWLTPARSPAERPYPLPARDHQARRRRSARRHPCA